MAGLDRPIRGDAGAASATVLAAPPVATATAISGTVAAAGPTAGSPPRAAKGQEDHRAGGTARKGGGGQRTNERARGRGCAMRTWGQARDGMGPLLCCGASRLLGRHRQRGERLTCGSCRCDGAVRGRVVGGVGGRGELGRPRGGAMANDLADVGGGGGHHGGRRCEDAGRGGRHGRRCRPSVLAGEDRVGDILEWLSALFGRRYDGAIRATLAGGVDGDGVFLVRRAHRVLILGERLRADDRRPDRRCPSHVHSEHAPLAAGPRASDMSPERERERETRRGAQRGRGRGRQSAHARRALNRSRPEKREKKTRKTHRGKKTVVVVKSATCGKRDVWTGARLGRGGRARQGQGEGGRRGGRREGGAGKRKSDG